MNRSRATLSVDLVDHALAESEGYTFLAWCILTGLCAFGLYLVWDLGFLEFIVRSDPSQITTLLLVIYLICTSYGGWRAWQLYTEHHAFGELRRIFRDRGELTDDVPLGWADAHCRALLQPDTDRGSLNEVLNEHAHGPNEFGWFLAGALLKLALLATVIGFMIMLSSINTVTNMQFSDLPRMIGTMGVGMGVSLYTTLVGLLANMTLSLQNLMLDRSSQRYVAGVLHFVENEFLPRARAKRAP